MIIIEDWKYFEKVCAFAAMKGAKHSEWLWIQLWNLHTLGEETHTEYDKIRRVEYTTYKCPCCNQLCPARAQDLIECQTGQGPHRATVLYKDFAPASFGFLYQTKEGHTIYNGGLIYHGNQTGWQFDDGKVIGPNEHEETFSVRIGESSNPWSIHT